MGAEVFQAQAPSVCILLNLVSIFKGNYRQEACARQYTDMPSFRWRLAEYLSEHQLSVYAVAKGRGVTRMNSIYRMARKGDEPQRVDLNVLAEVISELRRLTGKTVEINDILEYVPDPEA